MTLLAVERIKLFTTRSAWWAIVLALGLTVGFAGMQTMSTSGPVTVSDTQLGYRFALMVILVLGAIVVTSEYRFGTWKSTFLACANRTRVLLAKAALMAIVSGVIGEVAAFASVGAAWLFASNAHLGLDSAADWRHVAGSGLVLAVAAVIAVSVGALVRQTTGAVTLLLVWSMLVEQLVTLLPRIGAQAHQWMPFQAASTFLTAHDGLGSAPYGPWTGLAYFAGVAVILLIAAVGATNRRDA